MKFKISTRLMEVIVMSALTFPGAAPLYSQNLPIGDFDAQADVGSPKLPGAATYDVAGQQYTVTGGGENPGPGRDEFHFVWRRLTGNFIVQARAAFDGKSTEARRKLG